MRARGERHVTHSKRVAEARRKALWRQWHQEGLGPGLPGIEGAIRQFQAWNAMGASEAQGKANAAMVRRFAKAKRIRYADEITARAIQDHLQGLHSEALSPQTIHHHRNAIRRFCRFHEKLYPLGSQIQNIQIPIAPEQDLLPIRRPGWLNVKLS